MNKHHNFISTKRSLADLMVRFISKVMQHDRIINCYPYQEKPHNQRSINTVS